MRLIGPFGFASLLGVFLAAAPQTTAAQQPAPVEVSASAPLSEAARTTILDRARSLEQLRGLIVSQNGRTILAERLRGPALGQPVNIKSASKSIIAALIGRAIQEGVLTGVDQRVAELLPDDLPADPDPRLAEVTVGHLLSMQAGLGRTSGPNYGGWVASPNWVRDALARPFDDRPGGGMLYSTGSTHLLSAILTKASGRSTRQLFEDWLGAPLGIQVGAWDRDPQGIYLGGNNMALSPRALVRFGELMRNGGVVDGTRLLPAEWIAEIWTPRTRSVFSGEQYGYGWFIAEMRGHQAYYAWGYGGQMLYVLPGLGLTVAMTSDADAPSARTGYRDALHTLLSDAIIPAVEAGSG